MLNEDLALHFKPGDIIAYFNHAHNARHHSTIYGKIIQAAQTLFWGRQSEVNTRVTHIALIDQPGDEPQEPGYTPMWSYDILLGKPACRRRVEHNYALIAYRLKEDQVIHPRFTPKDLSKKAVEIAAQFVGLPYHRGTLWQVFWDWRNREGRAPGPEYTAWLSERFQIDLQAQRIQLNDHRDGVICPELVLGSYQLAWIMLAGPEAKNQALPDWLNFHAHCTPAGLVHFLSKNQFFERVPEQHIELLRYSGQPDPRDLASPHYVNKTCLLSRGVDINPPETRQGVKMVIN